MPSFVINSQTQPGVTIGPWAGQAGYLCCITEESYRRMLAEPPPGSVYVRCPECGAPVYVTPEAQELLFKSPQLKAVCTACAFNLSNQVFGRPPSRPG